LFKFHQRAFSWESLELIDELVHMHRGHDLRTLLHELVEYYSDRYLHRIVNGMYTYRFRSYFANEIEYLSRHSEEEMAAFNFTLDEAQTLRSHLERQLDSGDNHNKTDSLNITDSHDKTDILSMLGELHEFYQEYEKARQYYRRCINTRYPMIKEHVGERIGKGADEMAVMQAIYTNQPAGREALLALQHWGPITLRWSLLIVMTYERERNYNDALIRYERYITFAEGMIEAFATDGLLKKFDPGL
jgi:tetratricopeptide (TPR) repeat protein